MGQSVSRGRSSKQPFIFLLENQCLEEYLLTIAGCRTNFQVKEIYKCSEVADVRLDIGYDRKKWSEKIPKLFSARSDNSNNGGSTAVEQQ